MIIGLLIDLAVGLLCIILGLLIWRKQKTSLLHEYHYRNVKAEEIQWLMVQLKSLHHMVQKLLTQARFGYDPK